jgi:nicotinate phosphoribosyltransferase
VVEAIANFKFTEEQLLFLETNNVVNKETLSYLSGFRFTGNVSGYQEGELYFGNSPILTVEASFAEAVLLETVILSILNYDSAVASAAARMRSAASERFLAEMGSRRAHESAAVSAARAAYLVGFDATSNLEAGMRYGIPTMGTSAHSFTLLYETEDAAFEAQLSALGSGTTLLVDTFDVRRAVQKAVELTGGAIGAVRLDSGDLVQSAIEVRAQLDSLGSTSTKITVTSDLDEYTIAALAQAPVDSYGVGTSVVTGSGHPTAGFVYKLVSHFDNDQWVDVAKKSANKTSRGGAKKARRLIEDSIATTELIGNPTTGRDLQVDLIIRGEALESDQKILLERARLHHKAVLAELPRVAMRLSAGEPALNSEFV